MVQGITIPHNALKKSNLFICEKISQYYTASTMELKNKEIIVTGGAGFIGSNLVSVLAKDNSVTVIDNMHTGTEANLTEDIKNNNVRLIKADSKDISKANVDPDYIFHLGMYSSTPMYKEDNNRVHEVVEGAVKVFKYSIEKNAKTVFISSSSLYNGLQMPYSEHLLPKVTDFYTEARYYVERLAELYTNLYNLDATGIRLFSVYGKREENKKQYANLVTQFIWALRDNQPVIYGDGSQTRDFTNASDVVRAAILASAYKGYDIFNVGTGKSYSLNDTVKKINELSGKELKAQYVPNKINNYVAHTLADTRKSKEKLGFEAKVNLDEGIKELLNHYSVN